MAYIETFLESILLTLSSIFAFQIIGITILRIFRITVTDSYTSLAIASFLGCSFVVGCFAILLTNGKTILWGLFIVGAFLLFDNFRKNRNNSNLSSGSEKVHLSIKRLSNYWLELCILAVLIVAYRLVFAVEDGFFVEPVYADYVYYSKLSKYLVETGNEHTGLDYLLSNGGVSPYHYFEIWLNSIFIKVTSSNAVGLMIFTSYTIGMVLVWMSLMAVVEEFLAVSFKSKILSFLLLFFSGIYLGTVLNGAFWESTAVFAVNSFNYSKLWPLFVVAAMAVMAFRKDHQMAGSVLLLAPVLNFTTLPGTMILLAISITYKYIVVGILDFKLIIKSCLVIILFFWFYFAGGSGGAVGSAFGLHVDILYLKTFVNVIAGSAIQISLMYLPLLLLVLLSKRLGFGVSWRKHLIFLITCFIAFVAPWALLHRLPNSVQLFSNFFIPLASILLIFGLLDFIVNAKSKTARGVLYFSLVVFPVITFVRDISVRLHLSDHAAKASDNILELQAYFVKTSNPLGVYFSNDYSWAARSPVFGALDMKLQQFINKPGLHTISLSVLDLPIDLSNTSYYFEKQQIEASDFVKYIRSKENMANDLGELSAEEISKFQLAFIREFKIEYVLASYDYSFQSEILEILELKFDEEVMNIKIYEVAK